MNQADFLATIQAAQAAQDRFLDALTPDQQRAPNVCGKWSTKDVVVHLPVWTRYMTSMIRAWLRQRPATRAETWGPDLPPKLADDALNEWFVDQAAARSFDHARGVLAEVNAQLLGTVALLTDQELNAVGLAIPGLGYTKTGTLELAITNMSFGHVDGHLDGVRAALKLGI